MEGHKIPHSGLLVYRSIILIILKISQLSSKLHFSANCSFFGRSFSLGGYPPIYQPPKGVYLLNLQLYSAVQLLFAHMPFNWRGANIVLTTNYGCNSVITNYGCIVVMSVQLLKWFEFCLFLYRLCRETQTLSCVFGKKLSVVDRTTNMKISRRPLADYVKTLHQKACRTCSTITFLHSTNQIIDLWRCR